MSTEVGKIHYSLDLDKSKFDSASSSVMDSLKTLRRRIEIFTSGSVAAFATFGLKTAGDLESARQGFVTLLGSAEEADKVIAQIKKDAAQTPFELKGLIEANQALTAVTKNGTRSEKILLDVGKALAASGKGQAELDRMIANLQQIGLTGKITAMDIKQFGMSGINILEILADYYGTTTDKATEMVQNSKDGFGDIEKAFAKAGGAGGKFEKSFVNQAGTFNQSLSNMRDSLVIFASDFVKDIGLFDWAKDSMVKFTNAISNNKQAMIDFVFRLKDIAKSVIDVAVQVWDYLQPKLVALWNVLKENLMPALSELWHNVLEPLVPVIGTVIVVALGIFIDSLKITIQVVSWVINVVVDMINIFVGAGTKIVQVGVAIWNGIRDAFNWVIDKIKDLINWFKGIPGSIADAFSNLWNIIVGPFKAPFEWISSKIDSLLNKLGLLKKQASGFKDGFSGGGSGGGGGGGFAMGGIPPVNVPSVVGEKGPELFIPRTVGKIVPNNQLGVGGSTNIYGDINIADKSTADYFFSKLARNQELSMRGLSTMAGSVG